jgi:hypothetical protein
MTCARIFEVALRTAAWAVCVTNFDGIVNIARRGEVGDRWLEQLKSESMVEGGI